MALLIKLVRCIQPTHPSSTMKVTSPCYFWRLVVVIVLCCQSFSVIAQQPPKQQPESQSETTQECTVDEQTQQVACQPADDEKKNQNDDDSSTTTPEGDSLIAHGLRQIQWMRETCGGFVSEKFAIRRDNANRLGAFATGHFRMGETILEIPRQCILQTDHDDICETVELLREEMRKGEDSFFAPYTNYLSQMQLYGQLPALWSEAGQAKLLQLLGKSTSSSPEDSSVFVFEPYLPPDQAVHLQGCPSVAPLDTPELEKLHTYASMLVTQRGWDEVLVPLLDMLAHRNGQHWFNTDNNSVHANKDNDHEDNDIEENRTNDTPVRVWAKHDIAPGQELFSSYSHCTDCGARKTGYGVRMKMSNENPISDWRLGRPSSINLPRDLVKDLFIHPSTHTYTLLSFFLVPLLKTPKMTDTRDFAWYVREEY